MAANIRPSIDVVGVGVNAVDTLIQLPRFPASDSKLEFSSSSLMPGGQVASAMIACQKWGLKTRYVGKIGDDDHGELHRKEFAEAGVDARLIRTPGCSSQSSFILVDESSGERTVLWKRDERVALRPEDLERDWIVGARALLVDGHDTEAAACAPNPRFNSRTNDSSWISSEALPAFRSMRRTMALPTTTASTCRPSSATCSGVEIPKPTASGRLVTARTASTSGVTAAESDSRSPVTPVRETR